MHYVSAADSWRAALREWAIPPDILAAAPESPWGFATELFVRRAELASGELTFSNSCAFDALPASGVVLDVGCGGGAASVPLAGKASAVIGVDSSSSMLAAFASRLRALGPTVTTVEGAWPNVAPVTPHADVVVCHHVAYNVPDLAGFASRLTDHARARVVLELTVRHPMSRLNDLWLHFHNVRRPERPTADDAVAVLAELGYKVQRHDWESSSLGWLAQFAGRDELVGWLRRRLCLPSDRDADIWQAVSGSVIQHDGAYRLPSLPVVTLWWAGAGG